MKLYYAKAFITENKNIFLYDALLESLHEIEENFYKIIESDNLSDEQEKFYYNYINEYNIRNIINPPQTEISHGYKTDIIERIINSHKKLLILSITNKCNMNCTYCIYHDKFNNIDEINHTMPFETAVKAIDNLLETSLNLEQAHIGFYGGESLLEFDLIKRCVEYIKSKSSGIKITFGTTTNGILLNNERIRRYFEDNNFQVSVSLDGPKILNDRYRITKLGKGSYATVISNLNLWYKENPDFVKSKVLINIVEAPPVYLKVLDDFFCGFPMYYSYSSFFCTPYFKSHMDVSDDNMKKIVERENSNFSKRFNDEVIRSYKNCLTDDGKGNRYLVLSSEVGALEIPSDVIVKKERLHPGKMLLVDTVKGELIEDETLKNDYAKRQPYGEWLDHNLYPLADLKIPNKRPFRYHGMELKRLQRAFGYTYETMYSMMIPMALNGGEPTAAMGVDVPIPPLSKQNPPLFDYFKQLFAQVTNPPIDSIRESVITDTTVYLGAAGNLLKEEEANCRVLKVENPILTSLDLMKIRDSHIEGLQTADISMLYTKDTSLADAISNLYAQADAAHDAGAAILILTDRGVDQEHLAIPSLLAVAALETYLVRTRKNTAVSLIVETAEPTEVHHFATLLGFGASAVNPYLALDTLYEMTNTGELDKDYSQASKAYIQAVVSGIVKIASKMGISTIQSYQGSKIFEALGIAKSVCEQFFPDTVSRVGGIDLQDISNRSLSLHDAAFDPNGLMTEEEVRSIGTHKARSNQEEHLYNPETIHLLQQATWRDDYNLFKQYTACLNEEHKHVTLRSTLDFRFAEDGGIPLEEVESVESIMRRFKTGAMSYGSISQEAHECMAMAMNRIGGKSNSGEGGEDLERIVTSGSAVDKCSAIKQVASGRFGVTSKYLTSAKEIQIKMAQGAKPGEGGHLPAKKVYPWIAKTRHSTPGVALISPPPHHDIYSIEDLAQLIYDLKNANKRARISVKLVSEAGVGTIAAGVAKAGAGVILISGYDGGTGAAPSSSIHNAGLPWELGLAETHQTLIMNGLRSKVVIETDGKMMTGRDVIIAAMLGAEEYGFATAPLVTMGCVMMRVCNLDTCPAGVATQNPELRKRFKGKPEYIINFMRFIAQEMREYMAKLGIRTMDELIGRSDLLVQRSFSAGSKESKIDMSNILKNPYVGENVPQHFHPKDAFDFKLAETIDETTIIPAMQEALAKKKKKTLKLNVSNLNRTLGTLFGAEITRKYYNTLEEDTFTLQCKGSGGQSFGAFIPKGLTLELEGDSNDYFGKGLSGGTLVVYPPKDAKFQADENIIIGNVALFGATSGKAFIAGVAGERFCVRNSGATVVVEGVGDHGCEYMTGGCAVILGKTSKNFAAGMSGGIAYVLDEESDLYTKLNKALVGFSKVTHPEDVAQLKELITEHVARTHSVRGQEILDQFDAYLPKFKKIVPHDYAKMLRSIRQFMDQGLPQEEAKIEAFYVNTK